MKLPPPPAYHAYSRMPHAPPPPYMVMHQQPSSPAVHRYPHVPPPSRNSNNNNNNGTKIIITPQLVLIILLFFLLTSLLISNSLPTATATLPMGDEYNVQTNKRGLRHHTQQVQGTESCQTLLETERRIKEDLMDQVRRLEADVSELRLKNRELESDYRELSLSARASQASSSSSSNSANSKPMEDVSAVQRLSKCKSSLEESAAMIKELREGNKQVNAQVTRLQKELREAIADADEQEAVALACQKRLK